MSEKVRFAIVATPLLWLSYGLILRFWTRLDLEDVLTILGCFPLMSYLGVISAESGMLAAKDLRPTYLRLFTDQADVEQLRSERATLKRDLRRLIHEIVASDPAVREV